jgi:tetrahydromethanopterin S-methyltransferase subunit F
MSPIKIFRLSLPLAIIGYFLILASLGSVATGGIMALVGIGVSASSASVAKSEATEKLEALALPAALIEEFKRSGDISETRLAALDTRDRLQANSVLADYRLQSGLSGAATGIAGLMGGAMAGGLLVISLPILIVGLLISLRKKIRHCKACGYFYDLA